MSCYVFFCVSLTTITSVNKMNNEGKIQVALLCQIKKVSIFFPKYKQINKPAIICVPRLAYLAKLFTKLSLFLLWEEGIAISQKIVYFLVISKAKCLTV